MDEKKAVTMEQLLESARRGEALTMQVAEATAADVTALETGKAAVGHTHTAAQVGARPASWTPTAADVGAAPANHTHTAANVGAAAASHTHVKSQITDFPASMPASDVYPWAKSATKPGYTAAEVGAAAVSHGHDDTQISAYDGIASTSLRDILQNRVAKSYSCLDVSVLNDANYPYDFTTQVTSENAPSIGLPAAWWHILYLRHSNRDGFGAQLAIGLNAGNRMLLRTSNGTTWNGWTEVSLSGHTHTRSQITDFPTSMPASDVYAWAKAASKPTYTAAQVGAAAVNHTHTKSQITDFPSSMPANDVYSWAKAATKPSYTASEVGAVPVAGGTMTGRLYAQRNTYYSTSQVRNIYFTTSDLTAGSSALNSGDIAIVYE